MKDKDKTKTKFLTERGAAKENVKTNMKLGDGLGVQQNLVCDPQTQVFFGANKSE